MAISTVNDLIKHCGGVETVSRKLGVSLYTVLDWEQSNTLPAKRIKSFADEFSIDVDTLLSFVK